MLVYVCLCLCVRLCKLWQDLYQDGKALRMGLAEDHLLPKNLPILVHHQVGSVMIFFFTFFIKATLRPSADDRGLAICLCIICHANQIINP